MNFELYVCAEITSCGFAMAANENLIINRDVSAAIAKPLLAAGLSHDFKTMTIDETNLLHKKAETKKDGVYSFRGNLWAVKGGKFVAFINQRGQVLQRFGAFNTQIGDLSSVERWDWKKKLVEWLRSQ